MNVFTEVYNKSVELLKCPGMDDSWAYFAADMVGALSKGTVTKVLA